jgi:hypothetical protein
MPISSYIPTSAISKPGVCTSSTRPASPYEGQVIYQQDTDQAYVWNGSSWVLLSTGTLNPPGLELIKTVSFSNSSQPSITDVFSSTYDNYKVTINITNTSNSGTLKIQLRNSGGLSSSSYTTSGVYSYLSAGTQYNDILGTNNQAVASGVIGTWGGTSAFAYASLEFALPNVQTATIINFHSGGHSLNSGQQYSVGSVMHYTSFSATGFDLFPASGTATGTARVYGYRN